MFSIKRLTAIGVLAASISTPVQAKSHHQSHLTTCEKAWVVRQTVVHRFGKRAPGRNICRFGVVANKSGTRPAKSAEKRHYLLALERLAHPHAYLATHASKPGVPPAGTLSARYAPTGIAQCIVSRESGGNPQAVNGQYHGIAQWSHAAWVKMGGLKYASDPLGASYQEQLQVLNNGLSTYGSGDWSPYDGC